MSVAQFPYKGALHEAYAQAVDDLGDKNATPSQIFERMNPHIDVVKLISSHKTRLEYGEATDRMRMAQAKRSEKAA